MHRTLQLPRMHLCDETTFLPRSLPIFSLQPRKSLATNSAGNSSTGSELHILPNATRWKWKRVNERRLTKATNHLKRKAISLSSMHFAHERFFLKMARSADFQLPKPKILSYQPSLTKWNFGLNGVAAVPSLANRHHTSASLASACGMPLDPPEGWDSGHACGLPGPMSTFIAATHERA